MKQCKKCGVTKPISDFYKAAGMRDGYRSDCKVCNTAASKKRYEADPAAAILRVKRWQQTNADRLNAYRRNRRLDPDFKRAERSAYLQRKYGLTIAQYEQMLEAQDGGCYICGRRPSPHAALHVDHDHETGKIRGVVCFRCNNGLGDFDDDPVRLMRAAVYVGPGPRDPELDGRLQALKALRLRTAKVSG